MLEIEIDDDRVKIETRNGNVQIKVELKYNREEYIEINAVECASIAAEVAVYLDIAEEEVDKVFELEKESRVSHNNDRD